MACLCATDPERAQTDSSVPSKCFSCSIRLASPDISHPFLPSDPSNMHVLAVDDSNTERRLVEKLFSQLSCRVTVARNAHEALEILGLDESPSQESESGEGSAAEKAVSMRDFHLIVTDYSMPGMTGEDLLSRVKGSTALRDIPVVIMSSENVSARIRRCLSKGAHDFILKPMRIHDARRIAQLPATLGTASSVRPSSASVDVRLATSASQQDTTSLSAHVEPGAKSPLESRPVPMPGNAARAPCAPASCELNGLLEGLLPVAQQEGVESGRLERLVHKAGKRKWEGGGMREYCDIEDEIYGKGRRNNHGRIEGSVSR
eukprot:TRINITY_DN42846_c0_g1_i1.p1 TRINITY_DN42846_c0_g1~~TRINITY_DN42846_c0_g1_i1.p1  ORF type:complete len:318 (+),score=-2.32 TRINITY_DN42846_c0_g1_i1:103-1056(+)